MRRKNCRPIRLLTSLFVLFALFAPFDGTAARAADFALESSSTESAAANDRRFAVEQIGGVPTLTIDGRPTLARVFWGRGDGESTIQVGPERQTVEFEYVPSFDAEGIGTFHFRFGAKAGRVEIDDFSIIETATGKRFDGPFTFDSENELSENWTTYQTKVGEEQIAEVGVGATDAGNAIVVNITPAAAKVANDFHLYRNHCLDLKKGVEYRFRFSIRSDVPRRVRLGIYRPADPYLSLGGRAAGSATPLARQTKLAADADVDFVSFLYRGCWPDKNGEYDWTELDSICDSILKTNPNAMLIPRPMLDAPWFWLDRNPEARMRWEKAGALEHGTGWASVASTRYRDAACEALAACVEHLESKYGASIAGYHPSGQNTGEWFTPNSWDAGYTGFGDADRESWRRWLTAKYGTDFALRTAWGRSNDDSLTLANVEVPTVEERESATSRPYLDPASPSDRALLDFNDWTQETMTDFVLALAKTVREKTNGKKLVVLFYGYSFEFSGLAKGPAATAHYNLRALLDSPDVDVICSPISYSDRQLGGGCQCMLNAESVKAAGKMYWYEDDTRTYLATDSAAAGAIAGADDLEGSQELIRRNVAESAIRNFGFWLMDLGGSGWFDDSRLWDVVRETRPIAEYFRSNPTPYAPEIGVFLDETSMRRVTAGRYSGAGVGAVRAQLNKVGAPYGQYELSDLTSGRIATPKLCVLLNGGALTPEESAVFDKAVEAAGATAFKVGREGTTTEELRAAAEKAGVWLYADKPCVVWANGPFAVLHATEDGDVRFAAPTGPIFDAISGEKIGDSNEATLALKLGETRVLRWGSVELPAPNYSVESTSKSEPSSESAPESANEPVLSNESQATAPSSVKFSVDATKLGKTIGNKVAVVNLWTPATLRSFGDSKTLDPATLHEGADLRPFVEYVQLMQSTGGNADRDLFRDPANLDVLDDYAFEPFVESCRVALKLGVKPWIKLSVPSKLSRESKVGVFGVDVLPPDDFDVYYRFVRALAKTLVDEFGRDEVRSWRFGVLTEFENGDWFKAADGTPESSRDAFFKLYDHSVAALVDELGPGIFVGVHAMACTEGLWDERELLEHCANGINAKTGEKGTPLSVFAVSFYDDSPSSPHPTTLPATIARIQEKAREVGLNDLVYGVDEGRILGASKGAKATDLTFRIVGQTYQAAFDARVFKQLIDSDASYFSAWSYSSGNAWRGYPTVAYRVAEKLGEFKNAKLAETTADKKLAAGVESDAVAGFDESTQTLYLTAFNFKYDLNYADSLDAEFSVAVPFWAGKNVEIVETVVDDDANFFDEWLADKERLGISDDAFPWSPDSANLDSAIYDADAKAIYNRDLRPKYVEIANRPLDKKRVETVPADGKLTLKKTLARHGVVFWKISAR